MFAELSQVEVPICSPMTFDLLSMSPVNNHMQVSVFQHIKFESDSMSNFIRYVGYRTGIHNQQFIYFEYSHHYHI